MPPQGRNKQNVQGFLGVNLRRDRVSLADAELAKAINADLHEQPGTIVLRRGRRKQYGTALTDTAIRRLALVNGLRYSVAGQSVYRDRAAIFSGSLSPNLFTTMQAFRPLSDTATWVFIADDAVMKKDDGTRPVPWGIAKPSLPTVKIGGGGSGLTGAYLGGYTHLRYDGTAIAHESNVAQGADTATLAATGAISIANMDDAPSDGQVTGIGVYRSVASGAILLLDSRNKFPTTSTTFSVTHGWEVTASPGGTAASGLIHHWTVDKSTKRGTQAWEPVAAPSLRLISDNAIAGSTMTMPEHAAGDLLVMFAYRADSTSAPSVPAGWSTWGTGSGANTNSSVGGYLVATSSAMTSGTWTGATGLICHVYRGQRAAGAIGGVGDTGGSGTTITYPALTMTDTASTSLVIGFAGHRSRNTRLEAPPSGMTNRTNIVSTDSTGLTEVAGHDTDTAVSVWTNGVVGVGGTAQGWRARTLEIRGEPTTSDTTGVSEDARGYRATQLWEIGLGTAVPTGAAIISDDFATAITGWTDISTGAGAQIRWTAGTLELLAPQFATAKGVRSLSTTSGTSYVVTLKVVTGDVTVSVGTSSGAADLYSAVLGTSDSASFNFTASGTTSYLSVSRVGDDFAPESKFIDDVTVYALSTIAIVGTQTKHWAYSSLIADSALGAEAPLDNDVPPAASWVTEHLSHLFLCRVVDNLHHLRWSTRFYPERFPSTNLLEIGNPEDPVQCCVSISGLLGVFTKNTKYRVVGNTTTNFAAQEALSRRGTPCPLATIPTEYGIIFPHHDGIFRTDLLSRDDELSGDIARLFYGETVNEYAPINWAVAQTFSAAYRKGRYHFAYASGENTSPDTVAVYSRTTQKWYFFDHPARSLYVEQGDDETLTAGFTDGFVYVLEDGSDDAGSSIALDCETKDYFGGDPDVRKLALWARVDADCDDDTLSIDMYVDGTLKRTASLTGSRTRQLLPFPEMSMGFTARLGFRYTGTARPRIYGLSIIWLPLEAS